MCLVEDDHQLQNPRPVLPKTTKRQARNSRWEITQRNDVSRRKMNDEQGYSEIGVTCVAEGGRWLRKWKVGRELEDYTPNSGNRESLV